MSGRTLWQFNGRQRPAFAEVPGPGHESVWDYPRPPRLQADARRVVVRAGDSVIADSRRSIRVLETASPPSFYLPPQDVDLRRLEAIGSASLCEWKGAAAYRSIVLPDGTRLEAAAWCYPQPQRAFAAIAGWLSFYPARVACEVDGQRVRAQPGGFYGGWLTNEIVGPVKGVSGSDHW